MRKLTKILTLGGAAAVAGTLGWAALADMPTNGGGRGMGMGHGMGPGMMQHMGGGMGHGMGAGMGPGMGRGAMHGGPGHALADPAQIETLKTELGITPAQKPAWDKYAKAVQEAAETMKAARESVDHDALSKMSPADRHAFGTSMREQRQEQFETVQTAAKELLATLDETQKAKATGRLPGLAERGPGMGMRHGMRMRHGMGMMHGTAMGGPRHGHPNH